MRNFTEKNIFREITPFLCFVESLFWKKKKMGFLILFYNEGLEKLGLDPLPIPDIKIPYNLDKVRGKLQKKVLSGQSNMAFSLLTPLGLVVKRTATNKKK